MQKYVLQKANGKWQGLYLQNAKTSENLLRSSAYKCSTQNRPCQHRVTYWALANCLLYYLCYLQIKLWNIPVTVFVLLLLLLFFFSCLNSGLKDLLNSCAYNFHKCYLAKGESLPRGFREHGNRGISFEGTGDMTTLTTTTTPENNWLNGEK